FMVPLLMLTAFRKRSKAASVRRSTDLTMFLSTDFLWACTPMAPPMINTTNKCFKLLFIIITLFQYKTFARQKNIHGQPFCRDFSRVVLRRPLRVFEDYHLGFSHHFRGIALYENGRGLINADAYQIGKLQNGGDQPVVAAPLHKMLVDDGPIDQ